MNNLSNEIKKVNSELIQLYKIIIWFEDHNLNPIELLKKNQSLIEKRQRLLKESSVEKRNIPQNNLSQIYETLLMLANAMAKEIQLDVEISEQIFRRGDHAFQKY